MPPLCICQTLRSLLCVLIPAAASGAPPRGAEAGQAVAVDGVRQAAPWAGVIHGRPQCPVRDGVPGDPARAHRCRSVIPHEPPDGAAANQQLLQLLPACIMRCHEGVSSSAGCCALCTSSRKSVQQVAYAHAALMLSVTALCHDRLHESSPVVVPWQIQVLCSAAGTLFWLLTSNSYPDYDGYTVYTSRVAASEPRPAWPSLTPELFDAVRPRCHLRPRTDVARSPALWGSATAGCPDNCAV